MHRLCLHLTLFFLDAINHRVEVLETTVFPVCVCVCVFKLGNLHLTSWQISNLYITCSSS